MLKLLGDRPLHRDALMRGATGNADSSVAAALEIPPLGTHDLDEVVAACAADPIGACTVAARLEERGIAPRMLGGELWTNSTATESLCFSGANMIPLAGSPADMHQFARRAASAPRVCSSIVGHAHMVEPLWQSLASDWHTPREIRSEQPLLALYDEPEIAADSQVRRVRMDELDRYFPAAVRMFHGEVGVDPTVDDGGHAYRLRIAGLIAAGRAYARFDGDRVVFKAEIGSLSSRVGQIQGVWVAPEYRGCGLGSAGTAAVSRAILDMGRIPSLYVNSFNAVARESYRRIGFRQVGTFATVLID